MEEQRDNVKTVVSPALSGYIRKERLKKLLEELFGKTIDIYVSTPHIVFNRYFDTSSSTIATLTADI